jgi:uncharacterized coiled-coil protein SlyX
MKTAWHRFRSWWATQPARVRALLLVALPAALFGAFDALAWSPMQRETAQLRTRLATLEQEAGALEQTQAAQQSLLARQREQDARSRDELARLTTAVRDASARAVPPADTIERLVSLMRSTAGATAVGLSSEAPQPVAGGDLYRHPFALRVEGDYASLLQAVRTIERDLDALQWRGVELQVATPPLVRGRFDVFTLSGQNVWIRL